MTKFDSYEKIIRGLDELISGTDMYLDFCQKLPKKETDPEAINNAINSILTDVLSAFEEVKASISSLEDEDQINEAMSLCEQIEGKIKELEGLKQ